MTVTSTDCSDPYTGDGTTDTYPVTFFFMENAHLEVVQRTDADVESTLVLDTDYTVTGAGEAAGGAIVLTDGNLPSGYLLTISRVLPLTQLSDIRGQSRFAASVHEDAFDRGVMIAQQQQAQLDRVLVASPIDAAGVDYTLPAPEALFLLGWNAAADGVENYDPADLSAILLSGNFIRDTFVGGIGYTAGVTTALTLSQAPGSKNNCRVTFDGVVQHTGTFTLTTTTITFDAAIPVGVLEVEIIQAGVLPLSIPADDSVSTAKVQNSGITTAKIADGAVTGAKIADASVTLAQLASDALQGGRNGIVNGCGNVANGVDYVASVSGTYGYGKSELCKGALTGTAVAGTLTRVTNSLVGRTGLAFRWSALTVTGAGIAKFRFFIEAKDALKYKNQTVSVSGLVRHDVGSSVNFAIVVSKADVADVFSATTVISTGPTIPVASATNGTLYNRAISMGDCTNGIMVEITAAIGAVAGKLVDLTQVQLELGSVETDFEFEPYSVTLEKCKRLFQVLFNDGGQSFVGVAAAVTAILIEVVIVYPVEMRTGPTVLVTTGANVWEVLPASDATYSANLATSRTVVISLATVGLTVQGAYPLRVKNLATGLITADARF